jgi:hypothetical protein
MQLDELINVPGEINKQYLKDNITEDQLLLLYWYILEHEDDFSKDQLIALYEFLYEIDEKLNETDDE